MHWLIAIIDLRSALLPSERPVNALVAINKCLVSSTLWLRIAGVDKGKQPGTSRHFNRSSRQTCERRSPSPVAEKLAHHMRQHHALYDRPCSCQETTTHDHRVLMVLAVDL